MSLPSIDAIGYTYRGEGEVETCSETKTTPAGAVTEVTRHFYDGLERRTRTQRYDGYETTYGYDVKGNRTLVRDADGVSTAYTYDAVDRLRTATTPVGVATYDFFEDGLLKQTDYGNGLKETRTYDAAGRLETLSVDKVGQAVSRFDYGYDANGNRVSQVETRGLGGETTTYGYDEADRLIGVEYPAETHLYQVDAVGNRTGEKRAATGVVAALTVAAFAALSPAVASAAVERQHNAVDWVVAVNDVKASTTTALTYDANGNRTGEGTKAYRWDIRDTLTRVEDGAVVVGAYDYDAKLQRVKADTAQGHVEYVLDGKYVLREGGARSRRYHFGEGEALAVTGVGGAAGQDRWLLTDALGSVVTEADATATSVTARQFDAWGNYRNNTAPTANETRLGYTGHQFDVETGLTYARARYYDSKLGVFLSRDSFEGVLGDAPSLHRFTYSHNNPLRYRDPSGRSVLGFMSGPLALFDAVNESGFLVGAAVSGNTSGWAGYQRAAGAHVADTAKGVLSLGSNPLGPGASVANGLLEGGRRAMGCVQGGGGVGCVLGAGDALVDMAGAYVDMAQTDPKDWTSFQGERLATTAAKFDAEGQKVAGVVGGLSAVANYDFLGVGQWADEGVRSFGGSTLQSEAASTVANQTRKLLFQTVETTIFEDAQALGGMTCPCFEAGTQVHTKSGVVAIEEVRVGDLVLSKDDKTGVVDYRPVVQLFVTPEKEVFELRLSDDSGAETVLGVTPGHPFWVKDIGWVGAANLASGIEVANSSGGWLRVTGATWHQKKATVFNFEVEGFHTYFVGESAAWVHNACSESCKKAVLPGQPGGGYVGQLPGDFAPRTSDLQAMADDAVAVLDKKAAANRTISVNRHQSGRLSSTASVKPSPAQREVLKSHGITDVPPHGKGLRLDGPAGHHAEQRGIKHGQNIGDPVVENASSSGARHGGRACEDCAAAMDEHGVKSLTGRQ